MHYKSCRVVLQPTSLWLISREVLCSDIDTLPHMNIYQGIVRLGDYFMCPDFGSPPGHPPRVSPSSLAVWTHVWLWSRATHSSCLHSWSTASHSLSSVYTVVFFFICLILFIVYLFCLLYISENEPGCRDLLKFKSFLTNWHRYCLM